MYNKAGTPGHNAALLATKATLRAGNTRLAFLGASNPNVVTIYLQIFNKAAANVTVGTTVADWVIAIPASFAGPLLSGNVPADFPVGVVVAATTTAGGSTAPDTAIGIFWLTQPGD